MTDHVVGLREVEAALRGFPAELRRSALSEIARAGAEVAEREARMRAPRGKTGELARSIESAPDPSAVAYRQDWVVGPSAGTTSSRRPGFYGYIIERGSKPRQQRSTGRKTGRVRALHWMRRSLMSAEHRIEGAMEREARRQVAQAIGRVAR